MDGFELDASHVLQSLQQPSQSTLPTKGEGSAHTVVTITARINGACADAVLKPLAGCGCLGGCFSSLDEGYWSGIWGDVALVYNVPLALSQVTVQLQSLPSINRQDSSNNRNNATVAVSATIGNGAAAVDQVALAASGMLLEVRISKHGPAPRSPFLVEQFSLADVVVPAPKHSGSSKSSGNREKRSNRASVRFILKTSSP